MESIRVGLSPEIRVRNIKNSPVHITVTCPILWNENDNDKLLCRFNINISTSHASIAYRKQLPPQRTVGGNGRVRNESTPSKEASLPAYITHIAKNQQEGHQLDLNQLTT